jgi:peptidoglycan/LPS O-acetylase OafA/YrhL
VLLCGAAILYFLPIPHVMYLDRFGRFYFFFLMGGYAAQLGEVWMRRVDQVWVFAAVLLVGAVCLSLGAPPQWGAVAFLICGLLSMPALHGLVRTRPLDRSRLLMTLGLYSFVIYLLNTPFIGLAKGVMLRVMPWDGANFLLFAPLLLAAGIVLPVALKKYGLRHIRWLDRITS